MKNTKNSSPLNKQAKQKQPAARSGKTARSGLGCSLALVVLLIGLAAAALLGGPRLLAFVDQTGAAPVLVDDQTSPEALAARHNQELAQLNSYGWVDKTAGVARIPITRALALVAESALPVGQGLATGEPATADSATDLSNVNYQDDILPIFEQHCAECHGADDPEEGLQLTTYKGVLAGSFYGSVVKAGDPDNSYLVELVVTGQMPKKGSNLSQAEIDTIIAWINAGLPEQGSATADTAATEPISGTTTADTAAPVDLANVSFQNDVLPIFQDRCSECHGTDEPEEGLVLLSYKDVMAGSIYGSVVKAGAPDDSYLVEMIVTGQMPKKGDDLTQAQIDTIVAWIEAGALDN